jgi:hypothetical protein
MRSTGEDVDAVVSTDLGTERSSARPADVPAPGRDALLGRRRADDPRLVCRSTEHDDRLDASGKPVDQACIFGRAVPDALQVADRLGGAGARRADRLPWARS